MADGMDEPVTNIHHKYSIKRTSYKAEDLEKLKNLLEPFFKSNEEKRQNIKCLERFLRAFLTPEDAHGAILRYIEWRDKFDVDSLQEDDPEIIKEHEIGRALILQDKDSYGRPIVVVEARLHNPAHRDMHSITNYTVFMLELLSSKCNEEIIDNFCIIFDLKGFSLKNMDYTYVKRLIWILQNCYPERLGVCLIVNSPWVFYGCWSIIKLWLNEVTASKIIFIRNEEDLADFIDWRLKTSNRDWHMEGKKTQHNMYAEVKSVNVDLQASTCPKIVHFDNGWLKCSPEVAKRMKFDLHKPNSTEDPSGSKNFMTAESSNMKYIGKRKEQPCKYYLGVFDSETQQLDIHQAQIFSLHPCLIDDNNKLLEEEKNETKEEPSFIEKTDKLVEAFGSSRQKRALSARKKNVVDKVELNTKISQVADQIEISEPQANSPESSKDSITPPINLEATTAAQLYNIEHIISSYDQSILLKEVTEFRDANSDKIKQWRTENKYPEYILSHLAYLPISAEARLQKSIKLLYLSYLIRFFKLTYSELRKKEFLKDIPVEIRNKLLEEFSLERDKKRFLPKRLKDKALCYILVLALMIDEFILDCTLLMKDLKLGPARISTHLKAIGCVVETKKLKKDAEKVSPNTAAVTMARLKVPLPSNFANNLKE